MATADFPIWLILTFVFIGWYVIKSMGQIGIVEAKHLLGKGALILDVRSSEEFGSNHIKGSINLSLPELSRRIGELVEDKNTVLLCHCLSGVRSGSAVSQLKRMGYTAHNLGSLNRAKKLLLD